MVDIVTEKVDNCSILHLEGEIDASTALRLDQAIEQIVQEDKTHLILNCSNLQYISSAGLGVLISNLKDLQLAHRNVVLVNVSAGVMGIFALLGLEEYMIFTPDIAAALAYCS